MPSPLEILQQFWGYDQFRPLQAEIIDEVLNGRDVLALLPTGGGKSICFQVPGMVMDGITIVISPLIALMRDQVEQLTKRGIPATYVNSTLAAHEIDRKLQKAMDGDYKFLYLAPERLTSEIFRERVRRMKVCLLAVDEAHCISQWGYDFRPSYLEIAQIREWLPRVPCIALTATAPMSVREDIARRLELKNPAIFTQSFRRSNLHYTIEHSERIADRILEVIQATQGTGIVYARTRKRVKAMADFLAKNGVAAAAYHGGMKNSERTAVQQAWINGQVRVMSATNAFGMGIDKPDVRFVLHYNLPADPESYYQEAGRGGRDGKPSLALAFHNEADILELEHFVSDKFPTWDTLMHHWEVLCTFYQVQSDGIPPDAKVLDLPAIADRHRLNPIKLFHSIQILDQAGLLKLNEDPDDYGYVQVLVPPNAVLTYKERYPDRAHVLDHILRTLGGAVFQNEMAFLPGVWARQLGIGSDDLNAILSQFAARGIISYTAAQGQPTIKFLVHRHRLQQATVDWNRQEFLRIRAHERLDAMLHYAQYPGKDCRSKMLEAYFGEMGGADCGNCDVCKSKVAPKGARHALSVEDAVLEVLGDQTMSVRELIDGVSQGSREQRVEAVRELMDRGVLKRVDGLNVRLVR